MKLFKKIAVISLSLLLILSFTSCVAGHRHHTTHVVKHDNGKHKGWYKGKGNTKSHPGNNGKGHGKGKR
ncbi:MAG: hypothetical protein K0R65_245 [Crocinitomicaceae bacterium]|nr:hypothetical protein [Crocinitomicaceae bacterium]